MPQPPAPPAASKKKRQRMILIGGGALLLLVFLYMRSQGGSSNATSAADQQSAVDQAVANQQQQDAAQYAAQGYGAGASGGYSGSPVDLSSITSGLATIDSDIQNLPSLLGSGNAAAAPPAQTSPSAQAPITINVGPAAQPNPTNTGGRTSTAVRMSTLTAAQKASGIKAAPFGASKPTAGIPKGYSVVGLGSGNWGYKPPAKPASTKRKGP